MSRVILIAGGSGGIGSETARLAVARGDRVALVARDVDRLERTASDLGPLAFAYPGDVLDASAFAEIVERVERDAGEIDGVVHAVGSIVLRPLHALSLADWQSAFEINATSAFVVIKTIVTKMMRRRRGAFVLFSSVAARTGLQNHEAIGAAKGAVEGLVRSAAISYARYGIRFNAVAPALTKTELSKSLWSSEAMLNASVAMHPLGRVGEPHDIASAAHFLLSDDASWLTGQVIGVDGGLSAGRTPAKMTI